MVDLFHVTDREAVGLMRPRPSPPGGNYEGRPLVWAVDGDHLANYLLPRDCPRVCWLADNTSGILDSPVRRVVAIEQRWLLRSTNAGLLVHHLDSKNFECIDEVAGYWVSEQEVPVRCVELVDDCPREIARLGVELRVVDSLWAYIDEVGRQGGEFSVIRARNASPGSGDEV